MDLLRRSKRLQPKTYLDVLAEQGWLDLYLDNYSKDRMQNDTEYKNRVYDAMYNYSKELNEDVEIYFLEQFVECLSYFNEYTKVCRIATQSDQK